MKGVISFSEDVIRKVKGEFGKGYIGNIQFNLDETYWRNEFAKAAMGEMINMYWEELTPKGLAKECFDIAEAMVAEMRKRET